MEAPYERATRLTQCSPGQTTTSTASPRPPARPRTPKAYRSALQIRMSLLYFRRFGVAIRTGLDA